MSTAIRKRRIYLKDVCAPKTQLPPLRVEVFEGGMFCRYVDLPDPRAEYCDRFNSLAEAEGQVYRAVPIVAAGCERILLAIPGACEALSLSRATLYKYSEPRGTIPVVRIGDITMYSVDALRAWALEGGCR